MESKSGDTNLNNSKFKRKSSLLVNISISMKLNTSLIFVVFFINFDLVIKCNVVNNNSLTNITANNVRNSTEIELKTSISTHNSEARETRWSYYYIG